MKPRHSGIGTIFEKAGYQKIAYWHWDWFIGKDLYIDEVPKEKIEEVYTKLKAIPVWHKVILAVRGAFLDTGSPEKKTSYFEEVERIILNAQYD